MYGRGWRSEEIQTFLQENELFPLPHGTQHSMNLSVYHHHHQFNSIHSPIHSISSPCVDTMIVYLPLTSSCCVTVILRYNVKQTTMFQGYTEQKNEDECCGHCVPTACVMQKPDGQLFSLQVDALHHAPVLYI